MKPFHVSLLMVATLILGFVVGRGSAGGGENTREESNSTRSKVSEVRELENASSNSQVPTKGTNSLRAATSEQEEDLVIPVEAVELLAKTGPVKAPQDEFLEADEALIGALKIEDAELARIQDLWVEAVEEVRAAEASVAKIAQQEGGGVSIEVEALPGLRSRAREVFAGQLAGILGEDRGRALFLFKGGEKLLGDDEKTSRYHIAIEDAGQQRQRFRIEEESGGTSKVWIADAIPSDLLHLTEAAGLVERLHDASQEAEAE